MTASTGDPGPPDTPAGARAPSAAGDLERSRCDRVTWDRLLARTDLDRNTVTWLVRQAGGWPDYGFSTRTDLYAALIGSRVPLTETDLVRLLSVDAAEGPPSAALALAVLAHPAATLRVVCEAAYSCTSAAGGFRHDPWQPDLPKQILGALMSHPDRRVRLTTQLYAAGLTAWQPATGTAAAAADDPDPAAHVVLCTQVARIENAGVWDDIGQLLRSGATITPALVEALAAANLPPFRHPAG